MKRVAIALGAFALFAASPVAVSTPAQAAQYGIASYYWQPQPLASGGRFNPNAMSAAHKTLPFGTRVRVTRLSTGRSVVVTINDRGPYVAGRIIDLSRGAAQRLGMTGAGITRVRVDVVGRGGVAHLALGGNGGQYAGAARYGRATSTVASKVVGQVRPRRTARTKKSSRYAGVPASLQGKSIISIRRQYRLGGQTYTTSGAIPSGATLLLEEITYSD